MYEFVICYVFHLPPQTQTYEREDDDEDGRHGRADGHHDHLAVDLALTTVKVAGTTKKR